MKAAVYYRNADVRIEERPAPSIGAGEVLVKVMASAICGTDVLEWYRIKKAPLVLGHEIAGVVEESRAAAWRVGERVVVSHHVPCNACSHCEKGHHTACDTLHSTNVFPGGFAERIRVPALNVGCGLFRLPESVSFAEGALVEPLGCVVRAQRLAAAGSSGIAGLRVLVLGSGTAGLLHIKLAKARGAAWVGATDVAEHRLAAARAAGAETALASADVPAWLRARGGLADVVIVCAGSLPAAKQALQCVERGGTVLFFAVPKPGEDVPLPANELWKNEVRIVTSYAAAPGDMEEALELIASGKVGVMDLISHRLPLAKAQEGFALTAEAKAGKVVLEPHG